MLGGATNAINGLVSPGYFVAVLHWHHVDDIWRACVAQGVFQGLLVGLFFSLLFTAMTGILTKAACTYAFAFKHLVGVVAGACSCWLIGGLAGTGLAALSPEFFKSTFIGVPDDFGPLLAHAWVGGSIWGLQFGGFVCLILGLVILRANWRHATQT